MTDKVQFLDESIYDNNECLLKSQASFGRTFIGWNAETSIKSDYRRSDYNYFRDNNLNSRTRMLQVCQEAYKKVSIIKNVIDLMSDFGSKGIRIRHQNKKVEEFCQQWAEKVGMPERSERFLNTLYRLGTVIIYEKYGRAISEEITSKHIPIRYTFLNPQAVEVEHTPGNIISDDPKYVMRMYSNDTDRVLQQRTGSFPEFLETKVIEGKPINSERLNIYNHRKDDWEYWGTPIIYPILDDLEVLEKLKLADISALDGAISNIRLWTIGKITDNPQTTFMPTKPMLERVRNILSQGINGGSIDLVWGPELDFKESNTSVHQFLGEAKYKPTLDSIYDGLGIPSPLRSSNKDNNTGNTVSLKTLIERLNYGRIFLIDFWKKQLRKLFDAMGFENESDPYIEFDTMILTDEAAEKQLLLNMADRDMIDVESVQERFNLIPSIVNKKLEQEIKNRGGKIPEKAGPFHNPHIEDEMNKVLLTQQKVTPKEIGLDIDVPIGEQKERFVTPPPPPGTLGTKKAKQIPGRPKSITETQKRKPKNNTKASLVLYASSVQKQINDIFTPAALAVYGKKNVRSLTNEETIILEDTKARILFRIDPFIEITSEVIKNALENGGEDYFSTFSQLREEVTKDFKRELSIDESRNLISLFYSSIKNIENIEVENG